MKPDRARRRHPGLALRDRWRVAAYVAQFADFKLSQAQREARRAVQAVDVAAAREIDDGEADQ